MSSTFSRQGGFSTCFRFAADQAAAGPVGAVERAAEGKGVRSGRRSGRRFPRNCGKGGKPGGRDWRRVFRAFHQGRQLPRATLRCPPDASGFIPFILLHAIGIGPRSFVDVAVGRGGRRQTIGVRAGTCLSSGMPTTREDRPQGIKRSGESEPRWLV
jgi:hypothetical protein